ncbi:MAG: DUF4091 domain-containing protein [Planctomycetes bacterium]|nr:DUF4091 domain-containing protein [Planctomycetota bacterium]
MSKRLIMVIKVLMYLVVFAVFYAGKVGAEVLFEDNFDKFDNKIWQDLPDGATIDNGILTEKGRGGINLFSRTSFKYKNFEARVKFNNLEVGYYIGFVKVIPWNDSVCWNQIGGNALECRLGNRGVGGRIGGFQLETNRWYIFKITWTEEKVSFFIDGEMIGETDDIKIIPSTSLNAVIATLTMPANENEEADVDVDWVKVTDEKLVEEKGEKDDEVKTERLTVKPGHKISVSDEGLEIPGFTAGSSLLQSILGDLPKIIKQHNLKEIHHGLEAKEKWGTSVTQEDKERGYIVFSRHYLDFVFWYSLPNNKVDTLSVFASLGEYEPVSFSLYPFRDIEGVKILTTDLVNKDGAIIKKENIDIRSVQPVPFIRDEETYALESILLEKRDEINLLEKKASQLWLTVYVPEETAPGDYSGKIKIGTPGSKPYEVKLSLKVLPIKLQQPPDILYGMCFLIPGRKNLYPENLDKYFVDMREHNLNSMWTWPDCGVKKEGEKIIYDFSKAGFTRKDLNYFSHSLEEIMDGYLKTGFTNPWVCGTLDTLGGVIEAGLGYKPFTPEFDKAYLEYVIQLVQKAREKGWPAFSLHPIDEPGPRPDAMKFAKYYYKLLKENFPEIKTFADWGPWKGEDVILDSWVDIRCYAVPSQKAIEDSKKAGDDFWIYNVGSWGRSPRMDRLAWGLFTWKTEAKGVFHWVYTWWIEPKVPPSSHPSFVYVIPGPDGPIPTLAWEAVREGIDDVKYIYTLTHLIQKAKSSQNPELIKEAGKAEEELNKILYDVPVEFHYRVSYLDKTPSETFDVYRFKIAGWITMLQKIIERGV